MIEITGLTKVFGADGSIRALDNINLSIADRDIFGVIGMSGAGKSTLLRCIALLEQPTAGTISIDGQPVQGLKNAALIKMRREIGVIFQGYNLLMQRTVIKNVMFPLEIGRMPKEAALKRAMELLELVGLSDKAQAYPSQLSGGQKQRVAIARALAVKPKLLLCDEPTSALDSLTTRSILDLLKEINKELGVTILIITHEIGVVRAICNRVAVIDNSNLIEMGETSEVLEHPKSDITRLLLGQTQGGDR
ncbi:methionine ABC transporter ATP-binding protein [Zongyangia hominis]|uniref:ATP-binding cassette domain-containing protein n=1 Tax=Zongyangia hominis TaxID=2763677 RepID=A0A926ED56_9FIRM|nr:ATP-binding cassette domain-containing protein [Zongyangia hominis]MBC8569756.1 ATP-binding cassette domain-containing protein [Zongyangia hominis]